MGQVKKEQSSDGKANKWITKLWNAEESDYVPEKEEEDDRWNKALKKLIDVIREIPNMNTGRHAYFIGKHPESYLNKKGGFPNTGIQEPFKILDVARYFLPLQSTSDRHSFFEAFLLDPEEENEWFNKKANQHKERHHYFTHAYWKKLKNFIIQPDSIKEVHIVRPPSRKSWQEKHTDAEPLDKIYKHIAHYFEEAQERIEVLHLLYKGDNTKPGGYQYDYGEAQKIIYDKIQEGLEENRIKSYTRIFSLSTSRRIFSKKYEPGNKLDYLRAFASEVSRKCLSHIQWCLENHPDKCHFSIIPQSYYRHHVVIDGKVSFSEDYVYDPHSGLIYPRSIVIHEVAQNDKAKKWEKSIRSLIESNYLAKLGGARVKITDNDVDKTETLLYAVKEAFIYLSHQVNKRYTIDKWLNKLSKATELPISEDELLFKEGFSNLEKAYSKDYHVFLYVLKDIEEKMEDLGIKKI